MVQGVFRSLLEHLAFHLRYLPSVVLDADRDPFADRLRAHRHAWAATTMERPAAPSPRNKYTVGDQAMQH